MAASDPKSDKTETDIDVDTSHKCTPRRISFSFADLKTVCESSEDPSTLSWYDVPRLASRASSSASPSSDSAGPAPLTPLFEFSSIDDLRLQIDRKNPTINMRRGFDYDTGECTISYTDENGIRYLTHVHMEDSETIDAANSLYEELKARS